MDRVQERLVPSTKIIEPSLIARNPDLTGVYTFPISLAIPADAHPSLAVEYGRVSWKLKAHVHRPGALTARLSATHDVTVVALPNEDDTEDTGNILVERFWGDQLHYIFFISGKIFPVGGVIPLELRLLPMAKIRIAHIVMSIEGARSQHHSRFNVRQRRVC